MNYPRLRENQNCIQGIAHLKRKEISCYKPSDLWTQEDDLLFLKWVTNKRDRCYHTMSSDTSCRPHELLEAEMASWLFMQDLFSSVKTIYKLC